MLHLLMMHDEHDDDLRKHMACTSQTLLTCELHGVQFASNLHWHHIRPI